MRRLINFKSMDFIGNLNTNLLFKFIFRLYFQAAHCSFSRDSPASFAKLGNIKRNHSNSNAYTFNIIERISHPSYQRRHADNDIALFKLDKIVTLNDFVVPICLPQEGELTTTNAIATGWGRTGFWSDGSEVLMKVMIEYFNREACDNSFKGYDKLKTGGIDWDRMVCAGNTNKTGDTCQ